MKRIRKAVIPAAGFGTRFLPATKATPKEMLPVAEKPLIQYAFEEWPSKHVQYRREQRSGAFHYVDAVYRELDL